MTELTQPENSIRTVLDNLKKPEPKTLTLEETGKEENDKLYNEAESNKNRQLLILDTIKQEQIKLDPKRLDLVKQMDGLRADMANLDARETELAQQEAECIDRIEHYSKQMADAEMLKLRRNQR